MSEDNKTGNQENTAEQPERTFTQSEMDAIIGDRLKRERTKYADYEELKAKASAFDEAAEASKSDLQKATERADSLQAQLDALTKASAERELRDRISAETGVPASVLRGSTEDELRAHANEIMGFANANKTSYPKVKDGGELPPPTLSKHDILSIPNEKERLKAIKENIELFK